MPPDKMIKLMFWAGLAVASVAVLYFSWHAWGWFIRLHCGCN